MTQLALEVEVSLEDAVRAAAKECGITSVTCYDAGRPRHECPHWTSFRLVKDTYAKAGGASGPELDDFEAAVLIASGVEFIPSHPSAPGAGAAQ